MTTDVSPGKKYLEYGTIVSAHGRHGRLYFRPWSGDISVLATVDCLWLGEDADLAVPYQVDESGPFKDGALLTLHEVKDRSSAEKLRNTKVWVERVQVPMAEGEWLLEDLMGANVVDYKGQNVGTIQGFSENKAGVLFEIYRGNRTILIPWVSAFVREITSGPVLHLTESAPLDM